MRRRPRIAMIPMMAETRKRIAMTMHMCAEGMVHAPSSAMATEASKQLAIMSAAIDAQSPVGIARRTDAVSLALVAALAVMQSVEARHDAGKNWGVTGEEAKTLRAAAARFDEALRRVPFNVYEAARIFVEEMLRPKVAA